VPLSSLKSSFVADGGARGRGVGMGFEVNTPKGPIDFVITPSSGDWKSHWAIMPSMIAGL